MSELKRVREHVTERDLEDVLDEVLVSGERVVWSGHPRRRSRVPLLAFAGALVTAIALEVAVTAVDAQGAMGNRSSPGLAVPILGLGALILLFGAGLFRELLRLLFPGPPDKLYVVTQRRALVVRSRLGMDALELGASASFTLVPDGVQVENAHTRERLTFTRLAEPEAALEEIEDARRHTRNAAVDHRLPDEVDPIPEGPGAVEKFAERKRRGHE